MWGRSQILIRWRGDGCGEVRGWAGLCSRSLPQARQGAPLPAKPCLVAGGHRNLALLPREAPEEAGERAQRPFPAELGSPELGEAAVGGV